MDKLTPMSSPLGGNNSDQKSDQTQSGDQDNRRNLTRLDDRLEDKRLDSKLTINPLKDRLGDDRETAENKLEDEMTIERRTADKVRGDSILDDLKIFVPPRITDYTTLQKFFQSHVVELRFTRRHAKTGYSDSRRMVCTANWKFLSSIFTRRIFDWNTPKTRRGVSWYKRRGLIIVWDLMVKNFRIIPVSNIRFVSAYKCTSLMEKGRFLLFYKKNVGRLTEGQQRKYFNS